MTEEQIKHMVTRFLAWKLPEHFTPDNGISFDPAVPHPSCPPVGTNLLSADQATAMVRHMADGMPEAAASSHSLLLTPEYARLCGIAAASSALAAVYPDRCTAPPTAAHPDNCHCGQVLLDRALRATI